MTCSKPPKGRARWTLRLLENEVVELGIVDRASDPTIGRTLSLAVMALLYRWVGALRGKYGAPLQLHRSLDRLNALGSRREGMFKRGLEALIGVDQVRMLFVHQRGNSRAGCQIAPVRGV